MTLHTGNSPAPDYDVIVIGSGPAGCAAAINARRHGLSVLMITAAEESEFPEHRPSESLHPGITGLLAHLGALAALRKAVRDTYAGTENASGIHAFAQGEKGFHIDKSIFKRELLNLAARLRADILPAVRVTGFVRQGEPVIGVVTASGHTLVAKYTIDASGRGQVGAKYLDIDRQFFSPPLLCWSGLVTGISPAHAIFENAYAKFIESPGGWTWLAPEPSNGSCTYTRLSAKGQQETGAPLLLIGAGIHHLPLKSNMRWRLCSTVAMEGLILCGDAAAVIDPAAGQGNLNAIYSGIKASEAAAGAIRHPEHEQELLKKYSDWVCKGYSERSQQLRSYYSEQFGSFVFTL